MVSSPMPAAISWSTLGAVKVSSSAMAWPLRMPATPLPWGTMFGTLQERPVTTLTRCWTGASGASCSGSV